MGGQEIKATPPPPQKTVKEMVKEFSKSINKLRRDFQREVNKLEFNNKKIRMDLERMAKKKEPRSTMRLIAQNILKNNNYIQKYQRLDAQLQDVIFQLNQTATTETLVTVMTQMGQMMKQANQSVDIKNINVALEQFNMEVEKQNIVGEQIQDLMNDQDMDDNTDEDADKLINEVEQKLAGGGGGGGVAQFNLLDQNFRWLKLNKSKIATSNQWKIKLKISKCDLNKNAHFNQFLNQFN